ncbi:putative lipoprotein [Prevotella sp. BV3P1]|nr:putative lipoprotein [Prevotella sp. BV3P1]
MTRQTLNKKEMNKMKKNVGMTWLLAACLTLGVTSLTSCLGSNEDNQVKITKEEVQLAFAKVKGKHTGKLIYPQREVKSATDRTDTLDISWSLTTDSTMVIHNFPVKALAENVTNTDLRKLLLTAPAQDLKCNIGFYSVSPIAFVIQPTRLTYQLDDHGVSKKYEVGFYYNITGSIGVYYEKNGHTSMTMQIVQAVIREEGKEKEFFQQGIPLILSEKKKK